MTETEVLAKLLDLFRSETARAKVTVSDAIVVGMSYITDALIQMSTTPEEFLQHFTVVNMMLTSAKEDIVRNWDVLKNDRGEAS